MKSTDLHNQVLYYLNGYIYIYKYNLNFKYFQEYFSIYFFIPEFE